MSTPLSRPGITHSDTDDRAADPRPPGPTGDRVMDQRKGGQRRGILVHLNVSPTEKVGSRARRDASACVPVKRGISSGGRRGYSLHLSVLCPGRSCDRRTDIVWQLVADTA